MPRNLIATLLSCVWLGSAWAQLPPPPVSPPPVVNYEYDANGNPTKATRAGLAASSAYDSLDRRKASTDPRGKTTTYGYNGREDLTRVTDPRNLQTSYPRNGLGDATALISPDTGTATHAYDAAGNLKTRTDSRGVLTTYTYDALNRLTSATHTGGNVASQMFTWTYDQTGPGFTYGIGRLTSTQFPGGSTTYGHDPWGRVVRSTQTITAGRTPITLSTGYTYDAAGRVIGITYPSGRQLSIPHTGNQPSNLTLTAGGIVPLISGLQFEPNPGGAAPARSWNWHLDSGTLAHARVFDTYGRLVRYPLGGAVRDLTYDAADRIAAYTHYNAVTGQALPSLNQSFGYDENDRLTAINTSLGNWTLGYDDNGNRLWVTSSSGTRNYTTDPASNRLLTLSNPDRSLNYDSAGNLIFDGQQDVAYEAKISSAGRIEQIRGALLSTYAYDTLGQRVSKTELGVVACPPPGPPDCGDAVRPTPPRITGYVYDLQGHLLGEYDMMTGAAIREYVWLHDMPVAVLDGTPSATKVAYIQTDHLNTPRTVIDRAGRQRWTWISEPFGNSAPVENPVGFGIFTLNLRMPGQYFDAESGLVYNGFRSYDSGVGRYTQSDPFGLQGGINTYAYVESQPTSLTDPFGLATYMCRAPLHALTGALGEGRATWAMSNVPMAHHRYLCVPGQCGGQDQRGEKWSDPLWSPGKPSKDNFNAERCEQKEPDNTCIESCIRRRLNGPRPTYGIPLATDCQEWAEEVLNSCRYECSSSIPTDRPYIGYPSSGRRSKR